MSYMSQNQNLLILLSCPARTAVCTQQCLYYITKEYPTRRPMTGSRRALWSRLTQETGLSTSYRTLVSTISSFDWPKYSEIYPVQQRMLPNENVYNVVKIRLCKPGWIGSVRYCITGGLGQVSTWSNYQLPVFTMFKPGIMILCQLCGE